MTQADKLKEVLEVALLTSSQPLSIDDLTKLFIDKTDRSTIRMLLDEIKNDWQKKINEPCPGSIRISIPSKSRFYRILNAIKPR